MINQFTKFFTEKFLSEEVEGETEQRGIEFATAALLIEVSRSDEERTEDEKQSIISILQGLFEFNQEELSTLIELAEDAIEEAHDLHQFTRLLNENYDYSGRKELVVQLWRVAYADGRIDKFEEHIIRRIAGLLHVDNSDFVQAKISARN